MARAASGRAACGHARFGKAAASETARVSEERIGEVHIHLCHQESREQFRQLISDFHHLDNHHVANAEGDVAFGEKFFDELRIADDQPRNR